LFYIHTEIISEVTLEPILLAQWDNFRTIRWVSTLGQPDTILQETRQLLQN
jgi:hypothetical protein